MKNPTKKISLNLNANLKEYSTIHIGGNAKFLYEVYSSEQLNKVLVWCIIHNIKYRVIGLGANLIFDDLGYDGAIVVNKSHQILWRKNSAFVSSGMPVSKLIFAAQLMSLSGLENLSGIPATVGGAIFNNLGAFNCSFADCVEYVTCIDTKKLEHKIKTNLQTKNEKINYQNFINQQKNNTSPNQKINAKNFKNKQIKNNQNLNFQTLNIDKILNEINAIDLSAFKSCITKIKKGTCQFAYRDSLFKQTKNRYIILSCKLNLSPANKNEILQTIAATIQKKIESQPLDYPSAGSVFKRIYLNENNQIDINSLMLENKNCQTILDQSDIKNCFDNKKSNKIKNDNATQSLYKNDKNHENFNKNDENLSKNHDNFNKNDEIVNISAKKCSTTSKPNLLFPAKIIDDLGLKGLSVGSAQISVKHAGFIINTGAATQKDFIELTNIIKNKIKGRYNLSPQFEVEFVDY